MDAAAWLAEFAEQQAQREGQWRYERAMRWAEISAKAAPPVVVEAKPIVLEAGHDVEVDDDVVPRSASAAARLGIAAGWAVRVVASSAAVPSRGVVSVVTVRARRHDERLWAAWNSGGFDTGWYVGPGGLERVGGVRMSTLVKLALAAADRAAAKATIIPYKIGPSGPSKPVTTRGVLDVIEGVRGPKQWVDLLERQDTDRVVDLIRQAWPGLQLTCQ